MIQVSPFRFAENFSKKDCFSACACQNDVVGYRYKEGKERPGEQVLENQMPGEQVSESLPRS